MKSLVVSLAFLMSVIAGFGNQVQASSIAFKLYTPEQGSHADKGYYLHWSDGDASNHTLVFTALEQTSGNSFQINQIPIDAGLTGFEGNEYFWDTRAVADGVYDVRMDLLDNHQIVVDTDTADYPLQIQHETVLSDQEVYIYPFIHLKNSFIMESERDSLYQLLTLLDDVNFSKFEFTFNWPIAYYLENGLPDDRPGSMGNLFDPEPDLIDALIDYADAGGAIGAYEPLSGWHFNNIMYAYDSMDPEGDYTDWQTLGNLAIDYETRYQNQISGLLGSGNEIGAKHYLDQLFGRKTIELGSNQPVVNFHITRLLGNKVVSQWHPQEIHNDSIYRFIDDDDFYQGEFMFWFLGQLTFSHYNHELFSEQSPNDRFGRQVELFSPSYFDEDGVPQNNTTYQSFQESVDNALSKIRNNGFEKDIFYIFEHSISLQNRLDPTAQYYVSQYQNAFPNDNWGLWTYHRLSHMNCRDTVALPQNNYDYCFIDTNALSYKTTPAYLNLRLSVFKDSFRYIQFLMVNDPNLHIVSGEDLYSMVQSQADQIVSVTTLNDIAEYITDNIYTDQSGLNNSRLPAYVQLQTGSQIEPEYKYYTLAETHKILADALKHYHLNGQLPATVTTKNVVGPTTLATDYSLLNRPIVFTQAQIVQAASALNYDDPLTQSPRWMPGITPAESYMVPSTNTIDQTTANCAEMMYLMAQAYQLIYDGSLSSVTARPLRTLSEYAYRIQMKNGGYNPDRKPALYIDPNPVGDAPEEYYFNFIQLWTFKPAPIVNPL